RFAVPGELSDLARLLRGDGVQALEVHHLLGHEHAVLELADRLGVPVDMRVHDYAMLCPRVTLIGREGRYCGEPEEVAAGAAGVAGRGSRRGEEIPAAALRPRPAADLARARGVGVPPQDAAARLRRLFPAVAAEIEANESDAALPPAVPGPA